MQGWSRVQQGRQLQAALLQQQRLQVGAQHAAEQEEGG
jgi:hypothetical protein